MLLYGRPRLFGRQWALVGKHGAVADFVLLDFFDGFVGLGHGEALGGGFDAVAGGDVEHFAQARRGCR